MKQKSRKLKFFLKRFCALFVILCFIAGDLRAYADTAAASLGGQAVSSLSSEVKELSKNFIPPSLPASFTLPEELGSVQEIYRGTGPQTVLLIQDAHSQLEAQNSIQGILSYVQEQYGFRLLFLEGGLEGPVSPDLLRFYKNEAVNEQVAEKLLSKAVITGPGFFLLKHPKAMHAYGIENKSGYFGNILSYRRVFSAKPKSGVFLKQMKQRLATAASNTFHPALLAFSRDWLFYQDSHQDLLAHLEVLKRAAEKHLLISLENGQNQLEYPQLIRYFKLREIEKQIRLTEGQDQRGQERDVLLAWVNGAPFRQPLGDFLKLVTLAGKDSGTEGLPRSARRVLETFFEEARGFGFKWERYPSLNLHFARMILSQEIQPDALYEEVDGVTSRILQTLARTREEKKLLKLFRRYEILSKLFGLELSREEFLRLKQAGSLLQPRTFAQQLQEITAMPFDGLDFEWMEKIYGEALRFYEIAVDREKGMLKAAGKVFEESGEEKAVLVAGGFHSQGLQAQLRGRNISYVTVLPRISDLSPDENYTDQMMLRDSSSPRRSQVVQIGPDRVAVSDMPARDGAFITSQLSRVRTEVTQGLGILAPGPAEQLHASPFLTVDSRAEARSPRERNLLGKGLSLGKVQRLVGESLALQAEGNPGLQYQRDLTQERLEALPSGDRVDTIRNRASEEQALHNLVKNALDWNVSAQGRRTALENQSRFHGEGALGFLAELQEPDDYAILESKTENGTGFRVTFWNRGTAESPLYQMHFEEAPEISGRGTRITVFKTFENWKERIQNISDRLSVNTSAPLLVNKRQVNHPQDYDVLDPRDRKIADMNPVRIEVGKNGYRVSDSGTGMTEKEFFENFLHAGIPEKENEALQRARKRLPGDTRVYASHELSNETQTEGWINGHRVAVFSHSGPKRLNLVEEWIVDFPAGTPFPNAGDSIKIDERALEGLRSVIDRLTDPELEVENRFAQINSLALYLRQIQPEAERARLGKKDLLKYLTEKIKGRGGLIEKMKSSGALRGRIFVPNSFSAPDTLNGWAAFDHPKFIPLDEELFDFKFQDLENVTDPISLEEREVLVGQNAVLNTIPIYAAGWGFTDKLRGIPVSWILDENGNPALLIDSRMLRGENPNLSMIAGILEILAEKRLRPLLSQKNIKLIEVSSKTRKTEKIGFFAWLNRWRKAILAVVAVGLFVIAPLMELARRFDGADRSVPIQAPAAVSQRENPPAFSKPTLTAVPPKPVITRALEKKPVLPKGPTIQAPPAWLPAQNKNQDVKPSAGSGARVQLPQTVDLSVQGGARRSINKRSRSPFEKGELGIKYRSGILGTSVGQGEEVQEEPVYGFVENAISVNGQYETLLTGDIYSGMDNAGDWIPQWEVSKAVRRNAAPLNAEPIHVSVWGNARKGNFPLMNYYTGIIRNIRVTLINRKTNQADEKATQAFQSQWRRDKEHLVFDSDAPRDYFVKVDYDIDYYQPQDLQPLVSHLGLSQKEKDDFKKYFGPFLDSVKSKSDAEKLQAVTDFIHRVLLYDIYATRQQGALSLERYETWSSALADILTRGADPKMDPHQAVRQGVDAGLQGRVICNTVCPISAAALDYLGLPSAFIPVQEPTAKGELSREIMGHAELLVKVDDVYVKYDPTAALNYAESAAQNIPLPGKSGIVTNSAEAVQKRVQAYQDLREHFEARQKEGTLTEVQITAVQNVLRALEQERGSLENDAKLFMAALDILLNNPAHAEKTIELSRALGNKAFAYSDFLSDMFFQDQVQRREAQRKRAAAAAEEAKVILRDAQIDGFLTETEFAAAVEVLDRVSNLGSLTPEQQNGFIQSWIRAAKDSRISAQAAQAMEKLRLYFWEIKRADDLSYLDGLKTAVQNLHERKVLSDAEFAFVDGLLDQYWKDPGKFQPEDYDALSDWLDSLSQDAEQGPAIQAGTKKLDEDMDFSRSRRQKSYRAVKNALQNFQANEETADPQIHRVLDLMKKRMEGDLHLDELEETMGLLNALKNKYPEHEDALYFAMETLSSKSGFRRLWDKVLELKDEAYLTQRLVEVTKNVVPEAEVREFSALTMKKNKFDHDGLTDLLYHLEDWKRISDPAELLKKFETARRKLETSLKAEEELKKINENKAFWDFWTPWIMGAVISISTFLGFLIFSWETLREKIIEEKWERRKKGAGRGHNPELEESFPGRQFSRPAGERGTVYARLENQHQTSSHFILDASTALDEAGQWSISPHWKVRPVVGALELSRTRPVEVKMPARKVEAGGTVLLPVVPYAVIHSVKVIPVDEQGARIPSATQEASLKGNRILFKNEGWVEIQYQILFYSADNLYYQFPAIKIPENEKRDLKKYFGEKLDPYLNASWKEKAERAASFTRNYVILDRSDNPGPRVFRREAHHTSWAHALYEHIEKYGAVRADESTAVLIKFLLLNYLGLSAVRLKTVGNKRDEDTDGEPELRTGQGEREDLIVGIPLVREGEESEDRAAERIIGEEKQRTLLPLGRGTQAPGNGVNRVWFLDTTQSDVDRRSRFHPSESFWNMEEPGRLEITLRFVVAAGKFLFFLMRGFLNIVFKIIKKVVWPFPWMIEGGRRVGKWFREGSNGLRDARQIKEVLNFFEIPADSPVRRIISNLQSVTAASNRGWALLGSSRRARFRVLPEILKSSPMQLALMKKLLAYHRAQGPDSELIFFLGLFRLIDPATNQLWDYEYRYHSLPQSNSANLIETGPGPGREYEVKSYLEAKRPRSSAHLRERGPAGRPEGGVPFSPVYLYTGHSMTFSPQTLQAGEALLDYAYESGKIGLLPEVFELARLIMGTEIRKTSSSGAVETAVFPDMEAMTGRVFIRALNELKKHGNVNTTNEIKTFLADPLPAHTSRGRRLDELWRFNDEAQPDLDRFFPYPQREIVEYLIGQEGLVLEVDADPAKKLGPGISFFEDATVTAALENKPPSLAWLVDAAGVLEKKEAALARAHQAVPPLDFTRLREAVAESARGKSEPQNRAGMVDTIKSQRQPGMVRIREGIQNARDITREVPEEKREAELARFGGKREVRVRSFLNNEHPDGRLRKITSIEDSVGMTPEVLIMKFFPRWATTKSPAAIVTRVLKETLSVDEKVDTIFQKLVLASERNNPALRARIREAVARVPETGSREEDAAEILALMGRALDPDKKSAGLFGIGNYTIYDDADEVALRTGANGKVFSLRLKVIRETVEGQDVITDIHVEEFKMFEDPQGLFKGTVLQHIKYVAEGERHEADLEDRYMKYLFSKYVGAVSDVDIAFYRQTAEDPEPRRLDISIRDERTPLAQHGGVTVLSSKLKIERLTVDELYIQDPVHNPAEPGFFKYIPSWGMDWVHKQGINFQPRKSTPVTEARGAVRFPDRDNRDAGAAAMKALITAYRRNAVKPEGFPDYAEFMKNPKFFFTEGVRDPQIMNDAEILNEGGNLSHERWSYYFSHDGGSLTAAQRYNALFLLIRMPMGEGEPRSLMEEKERLVFGNVPEWIREQYFSNPEFQTQFAAEISTLPLPSDPAYSARTALLLFSTVVLLYSQNKLFFDGQNAGFPGMPLSLEDYLNPQMPKRPVSAAVLGNIRKARNAAELMNVDFADLQSSPEHLAAFLLEWPGKNGKSIHEVKDTLSNQNSEDEESVRRAAGSVSNKYALSREDSPLIAAFEDFTKTLKNVMEDRLVDSELRRFYFYKPFVLFKNNLGVLADFERFLTGEDREGRDLFAGLQKHFASEENVEAGFLFFSALLGTDMQQLRRDLLQNYATGGARENLVNLIAEKTQEGLTVEFSVPRAENRKAEEKPAAAEKPVTLTVSEASKLEVARAAAAKLIGPEEARSELKTEWMQSLWPDLREETLSPSALRLQDAVYTSTEKIAVLSVVPGDLDGADMESYAQGVMAGLAQKELTHEVMILIQGPSEGFAKRFEKAFSERAREMDRTRIAALNSKIHFVSAGSDFIQTILLSGMSKVMLAAPSDFRAEGLPQTAERVVVDRLASGENLFTSSERRGQLGAFVAASFEAALLPASEINEKDRVLIQNSDKQWYASSPGALQALGRSLGQMLRNIQAIAKAA